MLDAREMDLRVKCKNSLRREFREKAFSCRIKKTKIRKASKYWKNNFQAKQKCHDENA